MSKSITIKATLKNLETEESAIAKCFEEGEAVAGSLREHVYKIKENTLWEALPDCKSFKDYCGLGRIRFGGKQVALGYTQLKKLAVNGQVEQYVEKAIAVSFSENAYDALGKLRIEKTDPITGEVIGKTHELDVKKIKSVIGDVIKAREKAVAKPGAKKSDGQITAADVRAAILKRDGPKKEKSLVQIMKIEQRRAQKMLTSFEELYGRAGGEDMFLDADEESAGCVKRLATAYSRIASFLRKV